MNDFCHGSKFALARITDKDDNISQFRSDYPPICWEFQEVIDPEPGVKYHLFGTYLSWNYSLYNTIGGCKVRRYWRTNDPIKAPFGETGQPIISIQTNTWRILDGDNNEQFISALTNWQFYIDQRLDDIPSIPISFQSEECVSITGAYGSAAYVSDIIRVDAGTDKIKCRLRINDERGRVFQRFYKEECPEVSPICQGKKCPNNTCKVDCGDHYCCYNSDGKSVLEIAK